MTREEAIRNLHVLSTVAHPILAEACAVGIAALREQDSNANQHVSNTSNALGGWISAEDRLPEEAERVLVRLSGDKPPIGEPRMDTDRVVDGRWVRWFNLVTHWMPLPEPPNCGAETKRYK